MDAKLSLQSANTTIRMQGRYSLIYTASKWRVDCISNAVCRFPVTSVYRPHAGTLHYRSRFHALLRPTSLLSSQPAEDLTSSRSQISLTLRGRRGCRNPASLNLTATMLLSHKARLFSDTHPSSSMGVEGGRGFLPKCRSSAFAWMSRTWYKEETMADLVVCFWTAHIAVTSVQSCLLSTLAR